MDYNTDWALFMAQVNDTNTVTNSKSSTPTAGTQQVASTSKPTGLQSLLGGKNSMFMLILLVPLLFLMMGGGGRKKQKQMQQMLKSLEKGDKIQSIGGIIGTIFHVNENSVVINIDKNTKVEFAVSAIATVLEKKNGSSTPVEQRGGIFSAIKEKIGGRKNDENQAIPVEKDSIDSAEVESEEK